MPDPGRCRGPERAAGIRTILIDGLDQPASTSRPLAELLADPAVEIVLHAGRQDVAILRRAWRTELTNIFDTQIAAGFAGESAQSGYGNLIGSMLGLRVGKTASYTRWDARPLTAEQLSYAAEDVAHLLQLADELQRRLRASGRDRVGARGVPAARVRDRRARPGDRVGATAADRPARPERSRAVARRLAAWRERTASAEDRPVGSVLQDPPLVELAKRHPPTARQRSARSAASIRRSSSAGASRSLAAIAAGLGRPADPARGAARALRAERRAR